MLVPFTWKVTGWLWRYQKYVEHPPLSKVDAKGYMALRKWATQFYEVPT